MASEGLATVCALTNLDEASASIVLKKYNNDPERAVNAYFDNPDEALRQEPVGPQAAKPNIQNWLSNVENESSMGGVPAMSRPPSRVDATHIDLSGEHAVAASGNTKTLKEEEDQDMRRALAESLKESHPAQENGVTQTGAHFGPAKQGYNYDSRSWAMTTYASSREIIEHPPPSKRRRLGDAPTFLRGSKETGYLGSLLTIYNNIPLARESLLMPALKVHTYDHDNNWWAGSTDENNKALSSDNTLQIDQNERNLLTEVQCLMAFLDRTTRAYGSVDALADLQAVRRQAGNSPVARFMEAWGSAALKQAPEDQLTQVFSSTAIKANNHNNDPVDERILYCVEPFINHTPDETLTDMLDTTIWNDVAGDVVDDVWISHCAEIFTLRLQDPLADTRKVDVHLEPVWYADRYMYECREEMLQIRREVQRIRRLIDQLTQMQRRCQIFKSNDRAMDISEVLNAAVKASSVAAATSTPSNGFLDTRPSGSAHDVSQADMDELGSELQNVLQKIRQRLMQLEQRKDDLRARSRQVAMQLTKPTAERPDIPHRKYMLHGVATKPGVTYFRRLNTDLLEMDEEVQEYVWWRSFWKQDENQTVAHPPMVGPVTQAQAETSGAWGAEESLPWSLDRVSESDVLEAVKNEYHSVLLVYANENSLRTLDTELSTSLRDFVDRDNQAFAEDLLEEEGPLPDASAEIEVETEFEDVPLIDPTRSSSSLRELTPMSTSSPDRGDEEMQLHSKHSSDETTDHDVEELPSYEETVVKREMAEKKHNKIGLYGEQFLERYGDDHSGEASKGIGKEDNTGDLLHSEDP